MAWRRDGAGRSAPLALSILLPALAAGCPFAMEDDYALEASGAELADACADGQIGEGETDVDCGGEACGRCAVGLACERDQDCETKRCERGICAPCKDGGEGPSCGSSEEDG